MKDKINSILSEAKGKISDAVSEGELQNVKSAYIGKQGSLSLLMKEIPTVDVALRPEMGKLLNQAKNEVKDLIDEKRMELKLKARSKDFAYTKGHTVYYALFLRHEPVDGMKPSVRLSVGAGTGGRT